MSLIYAHPTLLTVGEIQTQATLQVNNT